MAVRQRELDSTGRYGSWLRSSRHLFATIDADYLLRLPSDRCDFVSPSAVDRQLLACAESVLATRAHYHLMSGQRHDAVNPLLHLQQEEMPDVSLSSHMWSY